LTWIQTTIFLILGISLFGWLGYKLGSFLYDDPDEILSIVEIQRTVKMSLKSKNNPRQDSESRNDTLGHLNNTETFED